MVKMRSITYFAVVQQCASEPKNRTSGQVRSFTLEPGIEHRFNDIKEDLEVLVFFAPAHKPS